MNEDIKLFYIDKIGKNIIYQVEKIDEEIDEVVEALINNDTDNIIEECWDVIQAILGLIKIKGLEKEFKKGFEKHKGKILGRGYKLEQM